MEEHDVRSLVDRLQQVCLTAGITVATAESCTGGLIASLITDVSGSSGYFRGGIVSYSNEAKEELLGVPRELVEAHGAVSAQVARAMASGARERLHADLAASVTGVAGPGGGSPQKPVGLTYVAVAGPGDDVEVRRNVWTGDRAGNKLSSAAGALGLLLERAEKLAAVRGGAGSTPKPGATSEPDRDGSGESAS